MKSIIFPSAYPFGQPLNVRIILVIWVLGLALGVPLSSADLLTSGDLLTVMREGNGTGIMIFLLNCIWVAGASLSIGLGIPFLGYFLVFLNGICRGFVGLLVFRVLGHGAWLARSFLLFSVSGASVLMFWLLIRNHQGRRTSFAIDVGLVLVLLFAIVLFDIFVISPFLSGIV